MFWIQRIVLSPSGPSAAPGNSLAPQLHVQLCWTSSGPQCRLPKESVVGKTLPVTHPFKHSADHPKRDVNGVSPLGGGSRDRTGREGMPTLPFSMGNTWAAAMAIHSSSSRSCLPQWGCSWIALPRKNAFFSFFKAFGLVGHSLLGVLE